MSYSFRLNNFPLSALARHASLVMSALAVKQCCQAALMGPPAVAATWAEAMLMVPARSTTGQGDGAFDGHDSIEPLFTLGAGGVFYGEKKRSQSCACRHP